MKYLILLFLFTGKCYGQVNARKMKDHLFKQNKSYVPTTTLKKKPPVYHTISGYVTSYECYYPGGTENPNHDYPRSYVLPNRTFYIRKGVQNDTSNAIVLSFTTNSEGQFSFQLPEGKYCILTSTQAYPTNVSVPVYDGYLYEDKYDQWKESFLKLLVNKDQQDLNIIISPNCPPRNGPDPM